MAEIGSLAVATLETLAGSTPATAPAAVPAPAASDDVARFEAAMGGGQPQAPGGPPQAGLPSTDPSATDPIDPAATVSSVAPSPAAPPPAAPSPGDAVLQGLQRMSSEFRTTMDGVNKSLSGVQPGGLMNTAELMRMQFALTQVTMQQDLTAKVTGKATQNLDTFLKNQ